MHESGVCPWAVIEWDDAADTQPIGRVVTAEEDRHEFLNKMITALGKVWYWDHRGVLIIRDLPSPTEPVFEVNHGRTGVLLKMGRQLSDEEVTNGVVATGLSADGKPPVRGIAVDADAQSPTYWHGKFGHAIRYFSSPLLTTRDMANKAAKTVLMRTLGVRYAANWSAVLNPALEPY